MKAFLLPVVLIGISSSTIASGIGPADYLAPPYHGKLATLKLNTPEAKRYRTVLREAAAKGANFAGHYTIVPIGAGSSTVVVAVVDEISGEVYFPKRPGLVTWAQWWNRPWGLQYQANSSLLTVYGQCGNENAPEGVSYFHWLGKTFELLKFVARDPGRPPK